MCGFCALLFGKLRLHPILGMRHADGESFLTRSKTPYCSSSSYTNRDSAPGKQLRCPLIVPPPENRSPFALARANWLRSSSVSVASSDLETTFGSFTYPSRANLELRSCICSASGITDGLLFNANQACPALKTSSSEGNSSGAI